MEHTCTDATTAAWREDGTVIQEDVWVACGVCGTMHRLTERDGICQVTAFPGPVRGMRPVTILDACGDPAEISEFAVEGELRQVGEHAGGIANLGQLPCDHCGQIGRMVTVADLRAPDGRYRDVDCPVCAHSLDGFGLTDWI